MSRGHIHPFRESSALRYVSTRGSAPEIGFEEALLAGLARDGGLYVPKRWPTLDAGEIRALRGLSYAELAVAVIRRFTGEAIGEAELRAIVATAYGRFPHPAVAPLVQLDRNLFVMELTHGPTLAFKDYAMQVLAGLFDDVLRRRGERVTIVGATSGDTGAAAIEAFRGRDAADVFIFFPEGRVSDVQQRQMTTVDAANVHTIALQGTFDDCQDMVKALFNDHAFRDRYALSAVNSINWARILPQIVYYFWAALALGAPDRPVAFSVPTGNFGNVFAAYAARNMGLPVARLIVATNENDILARFLGSGAMEVRGVRPTTSPSMDIQVSSNFERYLFDLYDRDGAAVTRVMKEFREAGRFAVDQGMARRAAEAFDGRSVDQGLAGRVIARVHAATGQLLDPHTAIGAEAADAARREGALPPDVPLVSLATAHPAKFPDAVEQAVGIRPALPPHLADLMHREEHHHVLANDYRTCADFIAARATARGAAA